VRDKSGIAERRSFSGDLHELTERIIGAFFLVSNELGPGFLESVYRRALHVALSEVGVECQEEVPIQVWFHGKSVGIFKADLMVEGVVILELKTADVVMKQFEAQLLHYLRATEIEVGMVLAFGSEARFRRLSMKNEVKGGVWRRSRNRNGDDSGNKAG